jgi:hypothetical protein
MAKKTEPKTTFKEKVLKEVSLVKTAKDLNLLIARYIDILEKPTVSDEDIRKAVIVSGFIGRQVSVENARISYERLSAINGKKYSFAN